MNDTKYKTISENVAHPCFFTVQNFLNKKNYSGVYISVLIPKFNFAVNSSIIETVNKIN
jgi:hypothetical protein